MSEYDRLKKQFDEIEEKQRSAHEKGLRNCHALAVKMRMMPGSDSQWEHVVRFCEEAGVSRSLLRDGSADFKRECLERVDEGMEPAVTHPKTQREEGDLPTIWQRIDWAEFGFAVIRAAIIPVLIFIVANIAGAFHPMLFLIWLGATLGAAYVNLDDQKQRFVG